MFHCVQVLKYCIEPVLWSCGSMDNVPESLSPAENLLYFMSSTFSTSENCHQRHVNKIWGPGQSEKKKIMWAVSFVSLARWPFLWQDNMCGRRAVAWFLESKTYTADSCRIRAEQRVDLQNITSALTLSK